MIVLFDKATGKTIAKYPGDTFTTPVPDGCGWCRVADGDTNIIVAKETSDGALAVATKQRRIVVSYDKTTANLGDTVDCTLALVDGDGKPVAEDIQVDITQRVDDTETTATLTLTKGTLTYGIDLPTKLVKNADEERSTLWVGAVPRDDAVRGGKRAIAARVVPK